MVLVLNAETSDQFTLMPEPGDGGNRVESVILKSSSTFHIFAGYPGSRAVCYSGKLMDFGAIQTL